MIQPGSPGWIIFLQTECDFLKLLSIESVSPFLPLAAFALSIPKPESNARQPNKQQM
jgi:hypothetical protein